jgi:hypothetical protein
VPSNGAYGAAQGYGPASGLQGANAKVRVEVEGGAYRAFVNDTPVSTLTDSTFTSGYVGLSDFSPTSRTDSPLGQQFDNVVISTLEDDRSTAPEPATLALVGLGLAGLGLSRWGRRA